MKELDALINRLEQATTGDTLLDADIHEAAGRGYVIENTGGEAWFVKDTPSASRQTRYPIPLYTTSLDAALTLVPNGYGVRRLAQGLTSSDGTFGDWSCCIRHSGSWGNGNETYFDYVVGATAALAVCVAALNAK